MKTSRTRRVTISAEEAESMVCENVRSRFSQEDEYYNHVAIEENDGGGYLVILKQAEYDEEI